MIYNLEGALEMPINHRYPALLLALRGEPTLSQEVIDEFYRSNFAVLLSHDADERIKGLSMEKSKGIKHLLITGIKYPFPPEYISLGARIFGRMADRLEHYHNLQSITISDTASSKESKNMT